MANLRIHVAEKSGKTLSGFGVSRSGTVTFKNKGAKELTIVVKDPSSPAAVLCEEKDGTSPQSTFKVAVGDKKDMYICDGFSGKSFTYSALIAGTIIEDPIIIIQKDKWGGFLTANELAAGAGVLVGIVLTLLARPLFVKSRPT